MFGMEQREERGLVSLVSDRPSVRTTTAPLESRAGQRLAGKVQSLARVRAPSDPSHVLHCARHTALDTLKVYSIMI